jgi:hypothetical protein
MGIYITNINQPYRKNLLLIFFGGGWMMRERYGKATVKVDAFVGGHMLINIYWGNLVIYHRY